MYVCVCVREILFPPPYTSDPHHMYRKRGTCLNFQVLRSPFPLALFRWEAEGRGGGAGAKALASADTKLQESLIMFPMVRHSIIHIIDEVMFHADSGASSGQVWV